MSYLLIKLKSGKIYGALLIMFLLLIAGLVPRLSNYAYSATVTVKKGRQVYYSESNKYIILKMPNSIEAYINKKNNKVYYRYDRLYYLWNKGIWFNSEKITGMFKITPQKDIPEQLRGGPLLRVKRKKNPVGLAILKVPSKPVKHRLPRSVAEHLYNLPLTLHGLVIYQKKFNFNAMAK